MARRHGNWPTRVLGLFYVYSAPCIPPLEGNCDTFLILHLARFIALVHPVYRPFDEDRFVERDTRDAHQLETHAITHTTNLPIVPLKVVKKRRRDVEKKAVESTRSAIRSDSDRFDPRNPGSDSSRYNWHRNRRANCCLQRG